jgi:hypothetical protein
MPNKTIRKPKNVERLPNTEDTVASLASATAPLIFFDHVGAMGIHGGIVHLSLQAVRFTTIDGEVLRDQVVVSHLRATLATLRSLKQDIEKIELLAAGVPEGSKN